MTDHKQRSLWARVHQSEKASKKANEKIVQLEKELRQIKTDNQQRLVAEKSIEAQRKLLLAKIEEV